MIRMLTSRYGHRGDESSEGQALVETALILTLMIFMSLATFDLGRGLAANLALTEATQEGAIYAAHRRYSTATAPNPNTPVTNAQIQTRVRTSSNVEAVETATVSVTCGSGRVTVTSTYALPVVSPLAQLVFGPTFTLNVDSKANILRGTCP